MFKKNVPEDQSFELLAPARNWRPSFDCPPSRGEEQTHSCLVAQTAVEAGSDPPYKSPCPISPVSHKINAQQRRS